MNTWAFRAPRLFQPWRIPAAFHSPAPLAQRKLLTPSGGGVQKQNSNTYLSTESGEVQRRPPPNDGARRRRTCVVTGTGPHIRRVA